MLLCMYMWAPRGCCCAAALLRCCAAALLPMALVRPAQQAEGIAWCQNDHDHCAGYTANGAYPAACAGTDPAAVYEMHFKDPWGAKRPNTDPSWSNWLVGGERPVAGAQIWAKPLGANEVAVLVINGGLVSRSAEVRLAELNISATGATVVTDVWSGADAGKVVDGKWSTGEVASLDSRFVVFEAARRRPAHGAS